jgi:hypothetical protein
LPNDTGYGVLMAWEGQALSELIVDGAKGINHMSGSHSYMHASGSVMGYRWMPSGDETMEMLWWDSTSRHPWEWMPLGDETMVNALVGPQPQGSLGMG